ncbi:SapC family protein [Thermocrinis minervae]|uniref:Fe-S-cluster containining protein n=1 Tax=Thermocrinis minervae TaxID=381751 RepID=A0A1M6TMK4_9AQUI|nr:SapC family protein [Thermocrinis minervae]SHK58143.1 Fe-S-cluster containining protein [Thermocrinis minervae]
MEKTRDRVELFSHVEPLDPEKHKNLRWECLKSSCSVQCCRQPTRSSIVLEELIPLSRYFPVVFTVEVDKEGEEEKLLCVYFRLDEADRCVYLKDGLGCLLGKDKPYACRQYPFLIRGDSLFVDFTCPGFSEDQGEPIFLDKDLNPYFLEEFIQYSLRINQQMEETKRFVKELFSLGIIVGGKYVMEGKEISFNFVDEEKLMALPKKILVELQRKGYLRYIYAHLNSLDNFEKLFNQVCQGRQEGP